MTWLLEPNTTKGMLLVAGSPKCILDAKRSDQHHCHNKSLNTCISPGQMQTRTRVLVTRG